jgi:signal transduction histidine kinase
VTPVFISLVVMIVILLMFYYFIVIYALNPIVEMNKSLGDWLRYKLPFMVKTECRDELEELKNKIESVTTNTKLSK